jgi:hypothetical protein
LVQIDRAKPPRAKPPSAETPARNAPPEQREESAHAGRQVAQANLIDVTDLLRDGCGGK